MEADKLRSINQQLTAAYEELTSTQSKLVEEEKMSAMGRLAGEVAHDIRNPLSAVNRIIHHIEERKFLSNNELMLEDVKDKAISGELDKKKLPQYLDFVKANNKEVIVSFNEIKTLNERLRKIANEFLEYSSTSKDIPIQPIDIVVVIKSKLSAIKDECKASKVKIEKSLVDSASILAFDYQIEKVLDNLIDNALKAMAEKEAGGKLRVTCEMTGEELILEIGDTGIGIQMLDLDDIFKPFFTKRKNLTGTGLGLAISKKIIENLNGSIHVESVVGEGSTFSIKLPLVLNKS